MQNILISKLMFSITPKNSSLITHHSSLLTHRSSLLLMLIFLLGTSARIANQAPPSLKLALLKYSGGGDWYNDVNSLKNLAKFCNENIRTNFDQEFATVESGSAELFNYPIIYATGHGNMVFSDIEARNLRSYLEGGGFLILNDDFGLDPFVRPAMKKVFPELDFVELPFSHPIYHQKYDFNSGMPKVHEHDGKPAQGFGLLWKGRLVCFYNFETDLGDGWDDVHNDPQPIRQKALQMGANIVQFAFAQ